MWEDDNLSNQRLITIALDGPAGAGKSTVARQVAEQLGYVYIDTGAMYRAVTLAAHRQAIAVQDGAQLEQLVAQLTIELQPGPQGQIVLLNGEDVTTLIRSREVTLDVSAIAAHKSVRTRLVAMQRDMAVKGGIVMDGRDIGTNVLPNADVKLFLTASAHVRALRRYNELKEADRIPLEQLEQEITQRDLSDQQRQESPLVCADDAIVIDSSDLTIEQVVSQIITLAEAQLVGGN